MSEPLKGQKLGECQRTACRNPHATWYNFSTRNYYCAPCALKIMRWPENHGLLVNIEAVPTIRGLREYLAYQYPATSGDIQLRTFCDQLEKEMGATE